MKKGQLIKKKKKLIPYVYQKSIASQIGHPVPCTLDTHVCVCVCVCVHTCCCCRRGLCPRVLFVVGWRFPLISGCGVLVFSGLLTRRFPVHFVDRRCSEKNNTYIRLHIFVSRLFFAGINPVENGRGPCARCTVFALK